MLYLLVLVLLFHYFYYCCFAWALTFPLVLLNFAASGLTFTLAFTSFLPHFFCPVISFLTWATTIELSLFLLLSSNPSFGL